MGHSNKLTSLISHRGNTQGSNKSEENHPNYIDKAIAKGFDVEIDLWGLKHGGLPFLGHDHGQYPINFEWLETRSQKLWIHCKDIYALDICFSNNWHYFFHKDDTYTLTSKGFVWGYPGSIPSLNNFIKVLPEVEESVDLNVLAKVSGICSDKIIDFAKMLN